MDVNTKLELVNYWNQQLEKHNLPNKRMYGVGYVTSPPTKDQTDVIIKRLVKDKKQIGRNSDHNFDQPITKKPEQILNFDNL